MNEIKWDYVFLFNNDPAPALLDRARVAIAAGRRVVIAYFSRGRRLLEIEAIDGCDILQIPVHFTGVQPRRALEMARTVSQLRREVFARVETGADVYTDALDLLFIARLLGWRRGFVHRHEVRDLHQIQLGTGVTGRLIRMIERLMLREVKVLVLTSPEHHRRYYAGMYRNAVVYVENVPSASALRGFRRRPRADGSLVVGFIGVIRYRRCLEQLVDAVRLARSQGANVRARFAGGGEVAQMRAYVGDDPGFEFLGPYDYERAARDLYADVDVIYSVYDPANENVRLAISHKFYESRLLRIPILVAAGTYLARLVEEHGSGTAVECGNAPALARLLIEAERRTHWYTRAAAALAGGAPEQLHATRQESLLKAVIEPPTVAMAKAEGVT